MDKLARKKNLGFSTVELMIAMAIMILVLTAVVLVLFSNQSFSIDSQTSSEAMKLAQGLLEEQQALGRKDFNLVNTTTPIVDGIYTKNVNVELLPDFLTKQATALLNWKNERGIDKTLELTTLISNFDSPVGANTCNSNLTGDWQDLEIENVGQTDLATLIGDPSGTYTITDLDAYKEKLYVTAGQTTNPTDDTLFIFDISDGTDPDFLGSIDNAPGVNSGLNAVRVSEDPASSPIKTYAYVASNTLANYSTCNPTTDSACGQFYIFNVTNPASLSSPTNLKILSSPSVTGQTQATSIFYKNSYVFLGLETTNGPEFHIIDVHNPHTISSGSYSATGSFETQDGINAISVRNSYAYLATTNGTNPDELRILNISSLNSPYPGPSGGPYYGFNSPLGAGHGKSLYLVGDKLYLGKTSPNTGNDFHILDNENPETVLNELGGLDILTSVNALIVRDYLSFALTNTDLKVLRTDDPSDVSIWGEITLPASGSATEPSMDCEDNRMYVSSNNASNKGFIYIIKPN